MSLPLTFGIIVFNGEPFTVYCLRSLYPFASEIIVVEGSVPTSRVHANHMGHSSDTTLETLHEFKKHEDPQNKLRIITAEDLGYSDGTWPGEKDEMWRVLWDNANGDWVWQVDVDEFYFPQNISLVIDALSKTISAECILFPQITFFSNPATITDGWYLQRGAKWCRRLFKKRPGYKYVSHRPPTILNEEEENICTKRSIRINRLVGESFSFMHYSLLFSSQVRRKVDYYLRAPWNRQSGNQKHYQDNFISLKNPFKVHNECSLPSWLGNYEGPHPPAFLEMWRNHAESSDESRNRNLRIQAILKSKVYVVRRFFWLLTDYFDRLVPIYRVFSQRQYSIPCLAFSIAFFITALLLGTLHTYPSTVQLSLQKYFTNESNINHLVIGSSQVWDNFDQTAYDDEAAEIGVSRTTHSIGVPSLNLAGIQNLLTYIYKRTNRLPENLLIDATLFLQNLENVNLFHHRLISFSDLESLKVRFQVTEFNQWSKINGVQQLGFQFFHTLANYFGAGFGANWLLGKDSKFEKYAYLQELPYRKYFPRYLAKNIDAQSFHQRVQRIKTGSKGPRCTESSSKTTRAKLTELKKMKSWAAERGSNVIFFVPPISYPWDCYFTHNEQIQMGIIMFNDPNRFPDLYEPSLRYDFTHFWTPGALRFSRRLAREVEPIRKRPGRVG